MATKSQGPSERLQPSGLISRPDVSLNRAISRFLSGVGVVGLSASVFALIIVPPETPHAQYKWVVAWTGIAAMAAAYQTSIVWRDRLQTPRDSLRYHLAVGAVAVFCHLAISQNIFYREGSQTLLAALLLNLWACALLPWRISVSILMVGFLTPVIEDATYVFSFGRHDTGELNGILMAIVSVFPLGVSLALDFAKGSMKHNHARLLTAFEETRSSLEDTINDRSAALLRSQEQLFRAQKIRTAGTLAAGLAHELNNILTPARGFAELLVDHHASEQAPHYARRILDATIASTGITRALLTYTKQTPFSPENTELRTFLRTQVSPMMSQIVPDNASLEVQCPRGIFVSVDRQMFQQSITNLVLNAADATREGGAIRIAVETEHPSPDPDAAHSKSDASQSVRPTGGTAIIRVSDNGTGIPTDNLEQIFDPFYTTKAHGTGLGLPTVQGIVERHGGSISVNSSPKGTSVCIRLPMQALIAAPEGEVEAEDTSDQLHALVLSNDVDLLDEIEALLEEASLRVTTHARSPGVDSREWRPHRFDVVVQDMEGFVIGSDEFGGSLVPRILLTDRQKHDPEALRGLSGNHVYRLRKPVDREHFMSVLTSALSSTLRTSSDGPGRA